MSRFAIVGCAFGWIFLLNAPRVWAEDDAHTTTLVNQLQDSSDPAGSSVAFVELRQTLRILSGDVLATVQARLYAAMWISDDAQAIRRTALVLAASPSEQAVVVLVQRLDQSPAPAIAKAVCEGIHAFADKRPTFSPATTALALERLETIARNGRLPGPVVDSAVMAMATFGSDGFRELMKLESDRSTPNKIRNVLYTAMGETDDPRALAVLREVASDASVTEGRRIQATYSLGQMFSRAAVAGRPIDAAERTACVDGLKRCLSAAESDRVFAASLMAVSHMVNLEQDSDLQQAVFAALGSASEARREAGLEVLFQQDEPVASAVFSRIREIAESDADPNLRCAATAVLDKQEAIQATPLSDAK